MSTKVTHKQRLINLLPTPFEPINPYCSSFADFCFKFIFLCVYIFVYPFIRLCPIKSELKYINCFFLTRENDFCKNELKLES